MSYTKDTPTGGNGKTTIITVVSLLITILCAIPFGEDKKSIYTRVMDKFKKQ